MKTSDIPQQIRQHLFSEEADVSLTQIIKDSGLQNISLIPNALFRLLTKDIPAHDFVETLAQEGGINTTRAKAIARALKEKLLETERYSLFRWGVDISDIKVHDAPTLKEIAVEEPEEIPEERKTINISDIGEEKGDIPIPIQKSDIKGVTGEEKRPSPSEPFILQEEKPQPAPAEDRRSILKSISIPLGFFRPKSSATSQINRSIKAEVETPNQTPKSQARVVHYSELRTSFSPFDRTDFLEPSKQPEEAKPKVSIQNSAPVEIKDERGEKPAPKITPMPAEVKSVPIAHNEEEKVGILGTIKKNEPRMEGNTLDLRQ